MRYVSLHHHSTYSYMDGFGTPAQHVERAAELDMSALTLTDHGNVSGHVALEKAALKAGIKPIFGLEAYTQVEQRSLRKFHLSLLAMDTAGYQNLNRIVTESWQDFYRYPTVSGATLAMHNEGIIVLSGCSDSLLACFLLGGKGIAPEDAGADRATELAQRYKRLLGDRFYLECQLFPELERTKTINKFYEELGQRLKIQLVATSDVHTLREGDHEMRALLHAAGRGNNTIAQQLSSWEYEVPDYIPTSDRWVYERAVGTGLSVAAAREACRNTYEIAQRCNVMLPKAPRFRYPVEGAERRW
jgi:DNA polymerase III subunit alpha